ncbi:ATP/GTP-binding protein, partial [Streptomyces sp. NPDC088341]
IRQAAIEAILDSSERITKTLLDGIALDHLAEDPP